MKCGEVSYYAKYAMLTLRQNVLLKICRVIQS